MPILVENKTFAGERPLYKIKDTILHRIMIGEGESAIKECASIQIEHSSFAGKYVCWEIHTLSIRDSCFEQEARASLWYVRHLKMQSCQIEAPKCFRHVEEAELSHITIPHAEETFWHCLHIHLEHIVLQQADYCFMHSNNIYIKEMQMQGNYSFQYVHHVEIHHAVITGRDAFWESEDCIVYDSELSGAYLGWYSNRLRLVRCHISGTQPLCYAKDLVLEDCTFDKDADLAFEYSSVHATIRGCITGIINPDSGSIVADEIGEVIINENGQSTCNISIRDKV